MDTCICTAESLRCLPETITALLISYNPIQNAFGVKKKIKNFLKKNNKKKSWLYSTYSFSNTLSQKPQVGIEDINI